MFMSQGHLKDPKIQKEVLKFLNDTYIIYQLFILKMFYIGQNKQKFRNYTKQHDQLHVIIHLS